MVYPPRRRAAGLTFVVTAANIPLSKYGSTISALNSADHAVVGFFVNVLNPPRGNHRAKARKIGEMFGELRSEFGVGRYDIVGHSIGGKIALLAAALYDGEGLIRSVVALDPVDQSPAEFTKGASRRRNLTGAADGDAPPPNPFRAGEPPAGGASGESGANLSLRSSPADITLTFTDTGYWVSRRHNAREIQARNPGCKLVMHRNSCHMVYCDDGGPLSWRALMGRGASAERNRQVREETLNLIKEKAGRSAGGGGAAGGAAGKARRSAGMAKKMKEGMMSDLKEMGEEAKRKKDQLTGAAAFSKVLG